MGPKDFGLAQKADRAGVAVYNRISKDITYVGAGRMGRLLAELGYAPANEPLRKIILSSSNGGNGAKTGGEGGVAVIREPEAVEAIWKEAMKKGQDSLYPPLSPREFGDYFARLANAKSEDVYQRIIIELDSKVEEWRKRDDSHSVRYLENLINAIKSEARIAREHRGGLDGRQNRLHDELEIDLERVRATADGGIKQAQERANRKLDNLEGRLDIFDIKTIVRYVAPAVATAGLAAYGAITEWMASLRFWPKAGVIAGALAAVGGALIGFRRYTRAVISRTEAKAANERKAFGDEGDLKQKRLLEEYHSSERKIEDEWAGRVRSQTVDAILRCFDIAIDFFPIYVANEIRALGAEWDKDFKEGGNRQEALKLLGAGLRQQKPFAPADS